MCPFEAATAAAISNKWHINYNNKKNTTKRNKKNNQEVKKQLHRKENKCLAPDYLPR